MHKKKFYKVQDIIFGINKYDKTLDTENSSETTICIIEIIIFLFKIN